MRDLLRSIADQTSVLARLTFSHYVRGEGCCAQAFGVMRSAQSDAALSQTRRCVRLNIFILITLRSLSFSLCSQMDVHKNLIIDSLAHSCWMNTKGRMRSSTGLCTFTRVESSLSSASRNRLEGTLEELDLKNVANNTEDNRRQVEVGNFDLGVTSQQSVKNLPNVKSRLIRSRPI